MLCHVIKVTKMIGSLPFHTRNYKDRCFALSLTKKRGALTCHSSDKRIVSLPCHKIDKKQKKNYIYIIYIGSQPCHQVTENIGSRPCHKSAKKDRFSALS